MAADTEPPAPPKKSAKYLKARGSIPQDLWPVYDALVEEYIFYALTRYGRPWAAYEILADLVKSGWRPHG